MFINQGGRREQNIPPCKVKFDSCDMVMIIRGEFVAKKGGQDLGRLGIFNCVILARRVRIKIWCAVAKKLSNAKEKIIVLSNNSRPIFQIVAN